MTQRIKKIALLHDTNHKYIGGAELSNRIIIQNGLKRGLSIDIDNLQCFEITKTNINKSDFVIVNNIRLCKYEFSLIDFLIHQKIKYVRWEHDYGFCERRTAACFANSKIKDCCNALRFDKYRIFFANSVLNIFQSPLHLKLHYKIYGEAIKPAFVLPPPVQVQKINCDRKIKNTVVYAGRLDKLKGADHLYEYIKLNPNLSFIVCGSYGTGYNWPNNVQFLGKVSNDDILKILSNADIFFFKPNFPEPSGRAVMEAYLSGCKLIINENVGSASFDFFQDDYQKALKAMSNSPTLFWDTVLNYIESVPSPMPLKKILVIKNHGGLGDYLLALPAINKIVEHFPDTVVVTPDYLFELISNLSNLKNVIPDSLFKSYDFKCNSIIDLGNYPNIQTTLKFPSHRRKRQHASQHYIDAVSRLDKCINAKPAQYPYFRKKTSKEYEISKYITIHPGAGFLKKCWEPINYYALIEKIKLYFPNLEIKIILGKNDPNPMKNEKKISGIDIVKNISLFKVAKILMHSIVHIGNDSGITHLAGALDIPIVALYGPTGPGTWSPVSSQKNIIYGKKNCDKECDYNVLKSCQNQTCLSSITVDEVIFMIMKIIYQRYCIKDSGCVAYLHPCLEIIEYSDALCLHNKLTCEDLLVFGNIKKALSFLNSLKDGCKITNPAPFKGEILSLFNFLKTEELLMLLPIKIY